MMSAAGTGYCFNTKRNRLRDKMVLRKHDPFGKKQLNMLCRLQLEFANTPMVMEDPAMKLVKAPLSFEWYNSVFQIQ